MVLAAANRDAGVFADAQRFDRSRNDGGKMLSFGAGMHECVARHLSVQMTAEALAWLFDDGKAVTLCETALDYEPAVNARLVKRMEIRLG